MMRRMCLGVIGLFTITSVMMFQGLNAAPRPLAPVADWLEQQKENQQQQDSKQLKDKLSLDEQVLANRFNEFQQMILRLKQRLERSPKKEDQDRAKVLDKALDRAKNMSLNIQFQQLVDTLKTKEFDNIQNIKAARDMSERLANELRELLALLREDDSARRLREERMRLEQLLKKIEQIIRDQKAVQASTQIGRADPRELQQSQGRVTDKTGEVLKDLGGQGGEGKMARGEAKGQGKGDASKGQGKNEGKGGEAKAGDSKGQGKNEKAGQGQAKGDPQAGKQGQGGEKSGAGQGKEGGKQGQGEAKSGEKAGQGGAKSGGEGSKGGAKSGGEGGKSGSKSGSKSGGQGGKSGQSGQSGQGGQKAGSKSGEQGASKAAGSKSAGIKSKEQQSDAKANTQKPQPQAEAKGGDKSSGKGDAKDSGAKKGSQGQQGGAKSGGSQGGQQGGGQQGGGQQGGQQGDEDDTAQAKKRVQDAEGYQKSAENNIGKQKNQQAVKNQEEAINELELAKKKLEELLRQIREEELERLLAALQARCERMLAMQLRVLDGTVNLSKAIEANENKQPNRFNKTDSLKLADDEKEIVLEATKAIEMLEAEGSAVAFPEVFEQVRQDMRNVAGRLEVVDAGKVTIAIEEDIVATLKEMIEALKKAQQDLQQNKNKSKSGPKGQPPDPKLLDLIAELKMIRSMQIRVNNRTITYGRQYQGEQAGDPQIRRELRQLSDRQERIFEVTNRLARGDNK